MQGCEACFVISGFDKTKGIHGLICVFKGLKKKIKSFHSLRLVSR
jgi:hypothetical protein